MISFNLIDNTEDKRSRGSGYCIGIKAIDVIKRIIVIDYIPKSVTNLVVFVACADGTYYLNNQELKSHLVFSQRYGNYIIAAEYSDHELSFHINYMGNNRYPYTFTREYEAVKHLDLFKQSAVIEHPGVINDEFTRLIPYTFGIEFETSMGFIPQEECFKNGLIPLRDGSITGTEYATIVMNDKSINAEKLLQQQLLTLRKYCVFNKECALHIHFGGFSVDPKYLFVLYLVEYVLECSLYSNTLPKYTFNTSKYKRNGKDYCKKIEMFYSFDDLYKFYACQRFYGDLTQPHPNDESRERKWQIDKRYYGLNLINMICYKSPKTVEFRFLRPTWNYRKIRLWLLVFSAVLKYSEKLAISFKRLEYSQIVDRILGMRQDIFSIIDQVYSGKVSEAIKEDLLILSEVCSLQITNNDYCGQSVDIENKLLEDVI